MMMGATKIALAKQKSEFIFTIIWFYQKSGCVNTIIIRKREILYVQHKNDSHSNFIVLLKLSTFFTNF
jgi:hypothetical protein